MKKSIKAALFSGLVFPGTGHFSLELYQRGMIFFAPALASLLFLIYYSLNKAYTIADQIQRGEIPLDQATITNLILAAPTGSEQLMLNIATWTIIACWIISIIDSYRRGHIAEQKDKA
jgi:hypothetical protein